MNSPLFRVVSHRCDNCIHCGYRWDWRAYVVENNHGLQVSEHSLQIFKILSILIVYFHRVHLPSSSILRLSDQPIRTKVKVAIYTQQSSRGRLLISELYEAFNETGK